LVNLDEQPVATVTVTSPSLRAALALSAADRRWIDTLTQTVLDTWDPENPNRPKNMGYAGSEDAIRLQFEEYILSLLSSMAYQTYHEAVVTAAAVPGSVANTQHYPDPGDTATDFNPEFLAAWRATHNFALFDRLTKDNRIFDMIEPRHPTAGGLNVEDVQRRLQQNLAELHLDDRVREGREQLGKTFSAGRERVGAGVARFWAEVEKAREARAAKQKDTRTSPRTSAEGDTVRDTTRESGDSTGSSNLNTSNKSSWGRIAKPNVDTAQLQAAARENAAKAGAYLGSWGTWARERVQQQQNQPGRGTGAGPGGGTGAGST
jgi:hypothetical protein